MIRSFNLLCLFTFCLAISSCKSGSSDTPHNAQKALGSSRTLAPTTVVDTHKIEPSPSKDDYVSVRLSADLSHLSDNQKKMLGLLIDASVIMDELFWLQAYGDKSALLNKISNADKRALAQINYGPWDRLNGDKPFVSYAGEKPLGAQFYPADMTKKEFEAATFKGKKSLYTLVRRDEKGSLYSIPYHKAYEKALKSAAEKLAEAAKLTKNPAFKRYLLLRSDALTTDIYQPSDLAWMDMKDNPIDVVIGPIETYEDQLYGYRAAYESYVLIKDMEWSKKLAKFSQFLPELQKGLPVKEQYKKEKPGSDSDLNAYDVIYYAGHSNAGSKTIAINLPNDEKVQLAKGTRRLQLKNAMRAKFDKILVPISQELIDPAQRKHITFDAFFSNTMFHEVAHGLGIKHTVNGKGTVRTALKETASPIEEGKADILGLYMVNALTQQGELTADIMDSYVTFMAGIFRSVRFGASSAHGRANMIRFNYFKEHGAFERDEQSGTYRVNKEKFTKAMASLSQFILTMQGDGNYELAKKTLAEKGIISPILKADLARLTSKNIPVDIVFEQGKHVLGLADSLTH